MNLKALLQRIMGLVFRGVVRQIDDSKKVRALQIGGLEGETRDDVEHFQQYGFTSNPQAGAEIVVVCLDGRREHAVVIACEDRRYRLKNLEQGEVAIYTDQGDKIVLKRGGTIAVTASTKVEITSPSVTMSGNLTVDGTVTGTTDVIGGGKSLKNHTHSAGTLAVTTAPGSVAGVSGGPT